MNHLILLLKKISSADMSGQGYMFSDSAETTNLRETRRIIPITRDEAIKIHVGEQSFQSLPTIGGSTGTNPFSYKGMVEIPSNHLHKTRAEGFKSNHLKKWKRHNLHPWFKRSWETYNLMDIRVETKNGLSLPFSNWTNPINQLTGVSHPKTEIYGYWSLKKGKSFTN